MAADSALAPALDLTLEEMIAMRSRRPGFKALDKIESFYLGDLPSRRRGIGLELDSVGPYQAGDDVRHIEWLATARTGRTQVKRFRAEFQWTMVLAVDLRGSMFFGTRRQLMAKTACLAAAKLAFSLSPYHQRLGWVCLTDNGPEILKPRRGRRARLQQLNRLVDTYRRLCATDISSVVPLDQALDGIADTIHGDDHVILLSDFSLPGKQAGRRLRELGRQHLRAVVVEDNLMHHALPAGIYPARTTMPAARADPHSASEPVITAAIRRVDDMAHARESDGMRQELFGWLADLGVRRVLRCDADSIAQGFFR